MEKNKYEDKILTFYDLIKDNKVEIPIIQRDYAQGRNENTEILEHFLTALKESLINEKEVKLDFIYGNIVNGYFQPLDGQQRLTTLFLLHWYAYMHDKIYELNFENVLLNFTYETRISSREFCNALVSNKMEILKSDKLISNKIIDSNWFFLSWKNDPTIKSMLLSIDKIHEYFFEVDNLWDKLVEKNIISFYYVELKNIGLTDDLYIKMNARGKLLTPFENFKAALQQKSTENQWEKGKSPNEKFSFLIDTKWTDFFWGNGYRVNHSVDLAHIRFIVTLVMSRICIENQEDKTNLIKNLNDNYFELNSKVISYETFEYLRECYEIYCSNSYEVYNFKFPFPLWTHTPKNTLLSAVVHDYDDKNNLIQRDSSYTTKVLFYAQTEYIRRNPKFNNEKFYEWMRVIRNIVSRGDSDRDGKRVNIIRSPQTYNGVINLVNELSEGCSDIYAFLNNAIIKSTFAKEQVEEEKIKAKLILSDLNLKESIWKAEDNKLLRGSIRFLLYCINYDKNSNLDEFDKELFLNLNRVFEVYFNKEYDISPDLRRAFLCISVDGEYKFYNYWWSRWSVNNYEKRKILDNYGELEYLMLSDKKEYFKKLVLLLIDKNLNKIAEDFIPPEDMPNWKRRLIKEKNLLNNAKSNYIAIAEDNSCCFLLKSRRPRDTKGCIEIK